MKLVAIDTSSSLCAVCVFDGASSSVLAAQTRDIGRGHAEVLMGLLETALDDASITYSDIRKIGVTCGPGSFAGVRVGLAAARGLKLALGIPAVGIGTLEGLAYQARLDGAKGSIVSLLDAGRGEVYFQHFGDSKIISEAGPRMLPIRELAEEITGFPVTLCGAASNDVNALLSDQKPIAHKHGATSIDVLAALAAKREPLNGSLEPTYVRPPDAKTQSGFALPRA